MTALVQLQVMELQDRLERAANLVGGRHGGEGFPAEDPHADSEEGAAALSDVDLVYHLLGLVDYVPDRLGDRFYRLFDEVFERFCPDVAWAETERSHFECFEDAAEAERELEGVRGGVQRRAALREAAHNV